LFYQYLVTGHPEQVFQADVPEGKTCLQQLSEQLCWRLPHQQLLNIPVNLTPLGIRSKSSVKTVSGSFLSSELRQL
jgi:hypothetical protein